MSIFESIYSPQDQLVLGQTPCLMAPIIGTLPPLEVGKKRFIIAEDGFYIEGKTHGIHVLLKYADVPARLPYGRVKTHITFAFGKIPFNLINAFMTGAVNACPNEHAAVICINEQRNGYKVVTPTVESASAGHITYRTNDIDYDDIVLDIHSHGQGKAYFSPVDDLSDTHIRLSSVFGRCQRIDTMTVCTRISIHGHRIFFKGLPWENGLLESATGQWNFAA